MACGLKCKCHKCKRARSRGGDKTNLLARLNELLGHPKHAHSRIAHQIKSSLSADDPMTFTEETIRGWISDLGHSTRRSRSRSRSPMSQLVSEFKYAVPDRMHRSRTPPNKSKGKGKLKGRGSGVFFQPPFL